MITGVLWRWGLRLTATLIIVLALIVGLFRLLLPLAPNYHAQIERWAGQALDVNVILSEVDARWPLWSGPELVFEDAALWSPDGAALLVSAERGSVELDLLTLLTRFEIKPGRIVLKGVVIDVEYRSADGGWRVLGRPLSPQSVAANGAGGSSPSGAARALPRGLLDLQDSTILVEDDRVADGEPQQITGVRLTYEHRRGLLRVDGALRPTGASSLLDFSIHGEDLRQERPTGRWQYFFDGTDIDLGALARSIPIAGTALDGRGDVRLWAATEHGRLEHVSVALALDDVALGTASGGIATYDAVSGQLEISTEADGWSLAGEQISLVREGHRWPENALALRMDADGVRSARADYLRLDDLLPLLPLIGEFDPQRAGSLGRLVAIAPRGEVSRLRYERDAAPGATLEARFSDLGTNAVDAWPGVEGLTGNVSLRGDSGTLELDADEVGISLPRVFAAPLPAMALAGRLDWSVSAGVREITAPALAITAPAFAATADFQLQLPETPDALPDGPWLDLQMALSDVQAALLRAYVPVEVMRPKVAEWLDRALLAGTSPRASIAFTGPIKAFPFENGEGLFEARAQLADIEFDYARGFPPARNLSGVVAFTNARMVGDAFAGEVLGNSLRTLRVVIDDLRQGVIEYSSRTRGDVPAVMRYLRASPYQRFVGLVEETAGRAETEIEFTLPLRKREDSSLTAQMAVSDGHLRLQGVPAAFDQIVGNLRYDTANGLTGSGLEAVFLERPVSLSLTPEKDDEQQLVASRLDIDGRFRMESLLGRLSPPLAELVDGTSNVRATARLRPGGDRIAALRITSDLVGTALKMPAPLDKPPGTTLQADVTFERGSDQRTTLGLDVGDRVRSLVELTGGQDEVQPIRAAVTFGGAAPRLSEAQGLVVEGRTATIDIGAWLSVLSRFQGPAPESPDGETDDGPSLPLHAIMLDVDETLVAGQRLSGLALSTENTDDEWVLRLVGEGMAGKLFVPKRGAPDAIVARFTRLHLPGAEPQSDADAVVVAANAGDAGDASPGLSLAAVDPRSLPTMVLQIDDFAWKELQLGQLELELRAVDDGVELPRLSAESATLRIDGSGEWIRNDAGERSHLELAMRSTSLLTTLEQLGFAGTMNAEEASLNASLEWAGPPTTALDAALTGEVRVEIGPGQLLNVRPGAGKIFGLMSVAALPRRLEFDFRDVFDKGLGFDQITGTFTIEDGQAYTDDLSLLGQTADVTIFGRTGLATRDYDQTAVVAANVGTTLPIAGAIAGGPVVGAALLIFSEVMKEPLKDLSRTQYRITGPWADPTVQRVALPNPRSDNDTGRADEPPANLSERQPSG
jgi:uncharacterized protein (TIGR02099 family)